MVLLKKTGGLALYLNSADVLMQKWLMVYSGQVLNNVRTVYNKMDEPRGIRGDDHK
jgi:hypothetical protein